MNDFKLDHGIALSGKVLIQQGDPTPRLMTLFSGWAIRVYGFPGGERQILNVLFPGDLLGLDSVLCGAPRYSVTAITDVSFCVFDVSRIEELLAVDSLAQRLAGLQALEQRHADERLASVGSCNAQQSLALLIWDLHHRLRRRGAIEGLSFKLPLTQQHLADALGITPVHVHRIIRRFQEQRVLEIKRGVATIYDLDRLWETACFPSQTEPKIPLL